MAEFEIPQCEAEALLSMEKHAEDSTVWPFPGLGDSLSIPLISQDKRERFSLDLRRSNIDLVRATYVNRCRQAILLARLDINGSPHRNPDGTKISGTHLHIYREGHALKWAIAPPPTFTNTDDIWQALLDFMKYCNVVKKPQFERGLFT